MTRLLLVRGYKVRVIQRSEPAKLPDGASFFKADAMNAEQLASAIDGATTVVFALGLSYSGKVWEEGWPRAMKAILAACDKVDARMVYADSLYLYGPQNQALHEALPPVNDGRKPTARSTATCLRQEAFADDVMRGPFKLPLPCSLIASLESEGVTATCVFC